LTQHIAGHSDHMEQYMRGHAGYVNSMNWYRISRDTLTTWAIYAGTCWLCEWIVWIDATYRDTFWPHGQYMASHSDHMGQYMRGHAGYVNSMNWYRVSRDTLTTWGNICGDMLAMLTLCMDTAYHDTLWPHGQYVVSHSDHTEQYMRGHAGYVDSMNWYNISRDTLTTWGQYMRDMLAM